MVSRSVAPRRWLNRWLGRPAPGKNHLLNVNRLEDRLAPATFQVTSNADSGLNSLRSALLSASITAEDDTINIGVTGNILLTTGELKIPGGVTLNGPTSGTVIVHGNNLSRVFNTSDAPAGAVININRVVIANGQVTGSGAGLLIGDESVSLTHCTVTGNKATGDGGGIHVNDAAGVLNISNCYMTGNQANGSGNDGGAISFLAAGTMVMDQCNVSGNVAADDGGGIYFRLGGKFTITNSTISSNVAGSGSGSIGGGLYFFGTATGPLVLQNCTISANSSGGAGGGIVLANFSGSLNLVNCTVTKNSATSTGITGGGLARTSGTGAVGMTGTIVAGNFSQSGNGPDVSFNAVTNVTGDGNFIGVADSGNAIFDALTNQLGTKASPIDAKLGILAYNGGPTPTHRPLSGSPVIDKGLSGLAFDQRGVTRVVGKSADVGAVETADSFLVTNVNDSGAGSLRRAVSDSNLDQGIFNGINFDATVFATPQTITLTTGELLFTESFSLNGLSRVTVNANANSRHFKLMGAGTMLAGVFGISLTNGQADGGGAIYSEGFDLLLSQVSLTDNVSAFSGGAISFTGSTQDLSIYDSVIANNQVTTVFSGGGGINFNSDGEFLAVNTWITGNSSQGSGGGVYATTQGNVEFRSCTIDNNSGSAFPVQTGGGGIYLNSEGVATEFLLLNSTVSKNNAGFGAGGGIVLEGAMASVNIYNSTVTENTASTKGGGISANGNNLSLISTIVANNTAAQGPDIYTPNSVGCNNCALGSKSGIALFAADPVTQSLLGSDFKLGPLANNGGLTPTHLPANDSPVVNQGTMWISVADDQRGIGYMRARSGKIDIGAVEANTPLVVTNADDAGPGSLRQAVLDANALIGPDVITFDPTFFSVPRLIKLTTGELYLNEAVDIIGPGTALATISGNSSNRIFNTVYMPGNGPVSIAKLTLANGKASNDGGLIFTGDNGGALLIANEHVVLQECVFTGNTAPNGSGGAVALWYGSTLTATDCTFSSNSAKFSAGAILTRGGGNTMLTLNRCSVTGNQADSAGGIYLYRNGLIENSTISGNTATNALASGGGFGGGIHFATPFAGVTFTIRNSTISGNKAETSGGGLHLNLGATLNIQNCTIVGNQAVIGFGGGIRRGATGVTNIDSSIIANNVNASAPDVSSGGTVNVNFSAITNASGFTVTGSNNLPFGIDLKIGPLANNGGSMLTHMLLPNSPAINQGDNPANLVFDQRGAARLQSTRVDIGAVESPTPAQVTAVIVNDGADQRSRVTSLKLQFNQIVHLPNPLNSHFQLQRQSDGAVVALNAAADNYTTDVLLTFGGGPLDFGSLADGRYTLTVNGTSISSGYFDGNGDGVSGDPFVLVGDPATNKLFRLFGDSNGDGLVTALDFNAFRLHYGLTGPSHFDFNNDNQVTAADFNAFRLRYGVSI